MSRFPEIAGRLALGAAAAAALSVALAGAGMAAGKLGLGRPATPDEIAAWDVNVMPDGRGLPPGSGSVEDGEVLFSDNCASCHGEFGEGVDNWPKLAGGFGTLADKDPVKTVGSYWPYLSTVWDYVHRSMPFGAAQTLTPDEVYAIVAYILYSNDLVEDNFVLSNENFTEIVMPNVNGFIVDDRPETEYPLMRTEPCMTNCKPSVEITMRARVLDVTPKDETDSDTGTDEAAITPTEAEATVVAAAEEPAAEAVAADPALIAEGEKVFRKCKACHQVGEGAKNRTGPVLNGVIGRPIASVEDFRYSAAMRALGEAGEVWTPERLAAYLADPKGNVKGTKMSFRGLKDDEIAAVTAYLAQFR